MRLLLDTHTFLWMALDDPKLSDCARELVADLENELWVIPASYWELAIKVSLGKYELSKPLDQFVSRELESNGISVLAIGCHHAQILSTLPFHHKDPFDRMLIAQALAEKMAIISIDSQFDAYGVQRIWKSPQSDSAR